jgi:hypothetical protein
MVSADFWPSHQSKSKHKQHKKITENCRNEIKNFLYILSNENIKFSSILNPFGSKHSMYFVEIEMRASNNLPKQIRRI